MLYGEKMEEILQKCNVDCDNLPDKLFSTKLNAICDAVGSGGSSSSGGSGSGQGGSGAEGFPIGDGNTHIWVSLSEGVTSPVMGVCVNGTATVDWGDGTEPDVLTGTDVSSPKYTPRHEYAEPGDYIITLTCDGELGFYGNSTSNLGPSILRYASGSDIRNKNYQNSVTCVEIGNSVSTIAKNSFRSCIGIKKIAISDNVTSIGNYAFYATSISQAVIQDGVTAIGSGSFMYCGNLRKVVIPNGVTIIGQEVFSKCCVLENIVIPDGVTTIGNYAFSDCASLSYAVIPSSVTTISSYTFEGCISAKYYDFSQHTVVPTLSNTNAFNKIPSDCEIRVPASLVDEWKAATNWSDLADYIVGV